MFDHITLELDNATLNNRDSSLKFYTRHSTHVFTRAVRRLELSFRWRYQIFFKIFFGRNGLRDKTSGHELSSRSLFLYSGDTC